MLLPASRLGVFSRPRERGYNQVQVRSLVKAQVRKGAGEQRREKDEDYRSRCMRCVFLITRFGLRKLGCAGRE